MGGYFLLVLTVFIILSCNRVEGNKQVEISNDTSSQPKDFVCNYTEYKSTCRNLLEEFKNEPGESNKQRFLHNIRDSLFACWLGTPWDFYGTTEEPNSGKIACGYFVTTLLRDMGVPVKRVKHAQCASEEMIKAVCIKKSIRRFSNVDISTFIEKINEPGLYIVGLDFHTGFILNDGKETYFIHANYAGNKVVEKEIAANSTVLATSAYRVIGKII